MKKRLTLLCMCISLVLCMLASASEKKPLNEIFTNSTFTKFNASFSLNEPDVMTIVPVTDRENGKERHVQSAEWITVMTEGFEGSWPAGLWTVSGNPTWDDDDFKPRTGSKSIWCARGGTLGRDPAVTYQYVNGMAALAPYGPFDLTGATDAELNFYHWTDCEYNFDAFGWFASRAGINYYGEGYTGNGNGWLYQSFDLTNVYTIGNVTGDASVWIAFYFYSDGSVTDYGTFVDDVVLRKYMDDTPPPEDEGDGRDSWVDADDYLHIPMTVAPPVIDGELDLEWYSTPVIKLLLNTANDPDYPSGSVPDDFLDATVEARAMWDNDYFYFFGKVIDDIPGEADSPNSWENDSFELYFDGDNSKNGIGPLSDDDVQWRWVYGELSGNPSAGGEEFAWSDIDYGYNFEMKIPASAVTFPLGADHEIGFEIQFNDRDYGTREHLLRWWSTSNNSWQQPEIWGSAILDPAQVSDILPCYSTDTPPVIDGVADAMWDAFPLFPTNCWIQGSEPLFDAFDSYFSDNWVDFRIAWDADNFYGILYMRDEANANPTVDCWNNDSVEIYWDGDNADSNPYDDNDTQARFGSDGTIEDNTGIFVPECNSNISLGGDRTGSDGYWVEFSVPWTGLNFTGINGNLFGFEVQANDNDDEGIDNSRESQARWWSDNNESWIDAGLFGTARFIGEGEPDIYITPSSFDVTLLSNQTTTQTLTIGNSGNATLYYDISVQDVSDAASEMDRPLAKDELTAIIRDRHFKNLLPIAEPNYIDSEVQSSENEGLRNGVGTRNSEGESNSALASSAWETHAEMSTATAQHGVVAHPNGNIYVFGGYTGSYAFSTMTVYNIDSDSWSSAASLPETNRGMATAIDDEGFIYSFSSLTYSNSYRYNPSVDTWTIISNPPVDEIWEAAAAKGTDGQIYVFGGEEPQTTNAVQIYNPDTDSWTSGSPMPTERQQHGVAMINGFFYVMGGMSYSGLTGVVEVYDPVSDSWSTSASMPTPRNQFAIAVGADNKIYTIGGKEDYLNNTGPFYNDVEVYDPVTDTWSTGSDLPEAIGEMDATIYGNSIYVIGGTSGTFEMTNYSLETESPIGWLTVVPMSGSVNNGDESDVSVQFDAATLEIGTYNANLVIDSNDPDDGTLTVPVTLTVSETLPDFSVLLTVSDNCSNTQDMEFGTAPGATDGFDADYDQYAPPAPPSGAFDARFTGVEDLLSDYRATNEGITTWTVEYQAASGCNPITLNWDNSQFPENGSFTLMDNITGNLVYINMRDQNTYTLVYPAISQLEIIYNLETSVDESIDRESYTFSLANNYPNPFNPTTNIHYSLKSTGMVKLAVYDLMGREVATLVNEVQNAGSQWVTFDAGDLASGVYFCQLEAGGHVFKQKMILLK